MTRKFSLDKDNAKLWGVCAGLSRQFGVDATFVRVGMVILTLLLPWTLLAYGLAAWLGKSRRAGYRRMSTAQLHDMEGIDRRIAQAELYVAGADSRLAREIEELR